TRRNFHGGKFFHVGDGWRFDAFAVNPVNPVARGGVDFDRYDSQPDEADHRRTLFGGYLALTGDPMLSADLYMLYQDDERPRRNFAEGDRGLNGARVYGVLPADGDRRAWDYDLEGGYQWGSDLGRRVSAAFATAEVGHTWKKAPWSPRLAGLVYYGSGGDRDNETFYTYHPLGHAYWGIIDNLAGQNLLDFSPQWAVNPTQKLNVVGAYHYFLKADGDGFLYNVAQTPVGPPTGEREIGHEVDLVATYAVNPNFNVQAGWAHFWYGEYVEQTLPRDDADFFYLQTTFNY
ncbi:MAG TPA: alginate export family protein, partial [Planctomycetaceae bacterium]